MCCIYLTRKKNSLYFNTFMKNLAVVWHIRNVTNADGVASRHEWQCPIHMEIKQHRTFSSILPTNHTDILCKFNEITIFYHTFSFCDFHWTEGLSNSIKKSFFGLLLWSNFDYSTSFVGMSNIFMKIDLVNLSYVNCKRIISNWRKLLIDFISIQNFNIIFREIRPFLSSYFLPEQICR